MLCKPIQVLYGCCLNLETKMRKYKQIRFNALK